MKRRSKAGGKTGKLRSRAAPAPKRRRNAPKTALRRRSATTPETEIARLRRELREALEQQSSTLFCNTIVSWPLAAAAQTTIQTFAVPGKARVNRSCWEGSTHIIPRRRRMSRNYEVFHSPSRSISRMVAISPAPFRRHAGLRKSLPSFRKTARFSSPTMRVIPPERCLPQIGWNSAISIYRLSSAARVASCVILTKQQ
jgi:hypothetical protein